MRVPRALQILIALCLMGLLLANLDGGEALRMLGRADAGWLIAALLSLTGQTLLSAWRWRLTAAQLGVRIAPRRAVREYYLAQIVNQSLPGGVAGDVGRAVRSRRDAGLARAASAVAIERLAGQIAMIGLMLTAVLCVTIAPGGLTLPAPVIALAAVVASGLAVAVGALTLLPRLTAFRADVARGLLARGIWPRQLLASAGTTVLNLLSFYFCARATGTELPVAGVLVLVPLILVTMVIPISVSGWGLREGAAAALFPVAGASAAAGLAASVAFGLMFLISTLPGFVLLLAGRTSRRDAL